MENNLANGFNNGRDALDGVGGHPGPIQLMEEWMKSTVDRMMEKVTDHFAEKKTFQEWVNNKNKKK